jgi:hypothetical protein
MDSCECFGRFARVFVAEQHGCTGRVAVRLELPATASAAEKFAGFGMAGKETSMFSGDCAALKGKGGQDFDGAAGFAKSLGIWRGGAAELFAGAFSEGIEGCGRSESGAGGNRGDFRFSGRRDRGSDVGRNPENGEGRGFTESVLDAELAGSGGGVLGGLGIRDAGGKAFTTEDTEETYGLKKEDVESRTCRCASGKRGGPPQKAVATK